MLASASPRRSQLLDSMGIEFEVDVSDFDEGLLSGLGPRAHAMAAARGKAEAVRRRRSRDWVVGVDTVVAIDGFVLGKPADAGDAARMLRLLSGRAHSVISAVQVASPMGDAGGVALSRVRFAPLSEQEIGDYVAGGEPFDKAGAYAIQGQAGEFVALERGRLDTVVGLPTHLLRRLLRELAGRTPGFANLGPQP